MAQLVKTTSHGKGRASHYHIAYVRDDGTGLTSFDNGHLHHLRQDDVSGAWAMEDGAGHTHSLMPEYDYVRSDKKEKDEQVVVDVLTLYDEALELERESREAGYSAENLYSHRQWDEKKKKELESKERAALTINKTESKIDNLTGYQRQNRMDIKYLPMENGDARVADILNIASKHITDACFFPREESKVFEDASIVGRGVFNVYDDFDEDIQGKIIIEKFKWDEAYFGPHEKEDLSDCEYVVKEKWFSIAKLKEMYPDKAENLSPESRTSLSGSKTAEDWDKRLSSEEFVNISKKRYKLIECQRKEYKRVYILANAEDRFVFNAEGWKSEDIAAVKTIPGFNKISRTNYRLRITKIASTVLLEDEYIEEKDFSTLPLYAKYRNGVWWGKIEAIKDLQFLVNKAYSQFVDILNKVANYGWFYDNQTFADKREEDRFRKTASSPGFVVKLADTKRPPEKVEGVKFPIELTNALAMFNQDMREILNVNLEMQGMDTPGQSGVAMKQKIVQQLLGNDFLFDNLSFVKKKLGQILVRKIQKLYPAERLMRILANEAARGKVEIAGQPYGDYNPAELQELLDKADLSLYDVVVSESPNSPSALMGNFMMLLELAGKGIEIPPQAILEFAPIPQKDKVMEMMQQQMEMKAQMEQKKFDTEIQKSLIAAQSKAGGMGASGQGMM